MICARCKRHLKNPGVQVVFGGHTIVLGPVCAARILPTVRRRRAEPVIPRTRYRAKRADQYELFAELA